VTAKILILTQKKDLLRSLGPPLEDQRLEVMVVRDEQEAAERAGEDPPDMLILDPGVPAPELAGACRRIRSVPEFRDLPILVLGEEGDQEGGAAALERGADDFVARPWETRELIARVRALLRRAHPAPLPSRLRAGAIVLDVGRYEVTVGGRPLKLTTKEFELLRALMESRGRVLRREELLEEVWGYRRRSGIESRTLDVHVRHLRKKLGAEGSRIVTVRSVGYRFDLFPEPIEVGSGKRRHDD